MGWGTAFKTEIYISRKIFRNIQELKSDIEELEEKINQYETQLKMYAIANPKDIIPEDVEVVPYMENLMSELLEMFNEDKRSYIYMCLLLEEAEKNPELLNNTD